MTGAVWYATGYLYSLYTAAEHSILALQQQGPACPWRLAAAADKRIQRLSVVLQAVSRSSWFTSCLGLSDMPLATHIAYIQPRSTRFARIPTAVGAPSTAPEGGSVAHIEHAKSTSRASEGCTDDFVHRRTTENRSEGRKTNQCSEPTTEQAAKKCAEKSTTGGTPNGNGGPCWEPAMLGTDSCNH